MDDQFGHPNSYTPKEQGTSPLSNRASGYATASLILGIIAIVTGLWCYSCCVFPLGGIYGVVAVMLAVSTKHSNNGKMPDSAVAGLILGIIAIVLCIILCIVFFVLPVIGISTLFDQLEQFYRDLGFDVNFDEYYSRYMPK